MPSDDLTCTITAKIRMNESAEYKNKIPRTVNHRARGELVTDYGIEHSEKKAREKESGWQECVCRFLRPNESHQKNGPHLKIEAQSYPESQNVGISGHQTRFVCCTCVNQFEEQRRERE